MTSAIGVRVYRIGVHRRGDQTSVHLEDGDLSQSVPDYAAKFIDAHSDVQKDDDKERSWYFEKKSSENNSRHKGYVRYGTFGFESNFLDHKTRSHEFKRKTNHVEEVPLFFDMWFPKNELFGFAAFQSFQGRSCIHLVVDRMMEQFKKVNKEHALVFKKLMPNDKKGGAYMSAPVKRLRLIKRDASSDVADQYALDAESIDFEVSISARRKRSLGSLSSIINNFGNTQNSVVTHRGIDFPEAVAEVRFGKRVRRVGVLGVNGDAGVIDLTEDVKKGSDGHPTFGSLEKEIDELLINFYSIMKGSGN